MINSSGLAISGRDWGRQHVWTEDEVHPKHILIFNLKSQSMSGTGPRMNSHFHIVQRIRPSSGSRRRGIRNQPRKGRRILIQIHGHTSPVVMRHPPPPVRPSRKGVPHSLPQDCVYFSGYVFGLEIYLNRFYCDEDSWQSG